MLRIITIPITVACCASLIGGCGGGKGSGSTGPRPPTDPIAWHAPTCTSVRGSPGLTFTYDGGATRVPNAVALPPGFQTVGIEALSTASTMLALVNDATSFRILRSADAGCSWIASGSVLEPNVGALTERIVAAGSRVYIWGQQSDFFYVVDDQGTATQLPLGGWWLWGLAVDPDNPLRLRAGALSSSCRASCGGAHILESLDGGQTWSQVDTTSAPYAHFSTYFSPKNLDHAIVTGAFEPAWTTLDGGSQWFQAQGFAGSPIGDDAAFGPDGQTVWIFVTDGETGAIYLSHDGGLNFQIAISSTPEHPIGDYPLTGGPGLRLYPHPTDSDVLYFANRSAVTESSYFYRYDASVDELTQHSWPATEGEVTDIAFNPFDEGYLYLGLSSCCVE